MSRPTTAANLSGKMAQKDAEEAHAQETLDIVYEIAQILDVGLDKRTLSILIALCEHGVNPEALAAAVKQLQREAHAIKNRETPRLS